MEESSLASLQVEIVDKKIKAIVEEVHDLRDIRDSETVSESTRQLAGTRIDTLVDQAQQHGLSRNRLADIVSAMAD
jgi:DNA-binding transcriptional regulator YhcF (GntR family)